MIIAITITDETLEEIASVVEYLITGIGYKSFHLLNYLNDGMEGIEDYKDSFYFSYLNAKNKIVVISTKARTIEVWSDHPTDYWIAPSDKRRDIKYDTQEGRDTILDLISYEVKKRDKNNTLLQ